MRFGGRSVHRDKPKATLGRSLHRCFNGIDHVQQSPVGTVDYKGLFAIVRANLQVDHLARAKIPELFSGNLMECVIGAVHGFFCMAKSLWRCLMKRAFWPEPQQCLSQAEGGKEWVEKFRVAFVARRITVLNVMIKIR